MSRADAELPESEEAEEDKAQETRREVKVVRAELRLARPSSEPLAVLPLSPIRFRGSHGFSPAGSQAW